MSLLKYTASADTTITDAYNPLTRSRAYFANMGAADSLEVFSIYTSGSATEKSRILINFPIEKIINDRNLGKIPSSGSVNFVLKLSNVEHPETLPKNFDLSIKPISGSWSEGYGLDLENYTDIGETQDGGAGVNWKYRSSPESELLVWSLDGGDFFNQYEKIVHVDNGTEDLNVDITHIVEDQISNVIPPHGIAIMLASSFENGSLAKTFYTKRFSARSSEYFYKTPAIEARWETVIKDDRNSFFYESPNLEPAENIQNIYFYNKINGILKDLPGNIQPLVKIYDEDALLTSSIQSSKVSTGTYVASFALTGSDNVYLQDVWYSGSNIYFKSQINASPRTFSDVNTDSEYVFNITNLKNSYKNYEFPCIRIYARQKNWSPNIYKIANSNIESINFKNLYYKVYRIVDNLTVIDYGIEPVAYTKCSYDKLGNYFDLDMSFLEPGYAYGIKLMLLNGSNKQEIPNTFKFKVE